mmetsp:Transcript_25409/g.53560  ORF Transcript_25409/g.53560 Transcript_25409/m.53560 type:complete len:265 (+) Transcript_25409:817-1611(+)
MAPETMGGKRLRSTTCNGGKTKQHKSKSTIRGATTTTQTHTPGAKDTGNGCCYATFASDVYSFGVVLWELIGLQEFDRRYDSRLEEFESAVCDHRYRPNIQAVEQAIADDFDEYLQNSSSSNEPLTSGPAVAASAAFLCRHRDLRKLVEACWHEDCRQRPCFEFIIAELKEMVPPPVLFFDDTNNPRQHQQQQQQQEYQGGSKKELRPLLLRKHPMNPIYRLKGSTRKRKQANPCSCCKKNNYTRKRIFNQDQQQQQQQLEYQQ